MTRKTLAMEKELVQWKIKAESDRKIPDHDGLCESIAADRDAEVGYRSAVDAGDSTPSTSEF